MKNSARAWLWPLEHRNCHGLISPSSGVYLEENIVLRALENATDKDIENLTGIVGRMESVLAIEEQFEWKSCLDLDKKFHLYLAKMAVNPIYDLILRTFLDNLGIYHQAYKHRRIEFGHDKIDNIKRIVEAIV